MTRQRSPALWLLLVSFALTPACDAESSADGSGGGGGPAPDAIADAPEDLPSAPDGGQPDLPTADSGPTTIPTEVLSYVADDIAPGPLSFARDLGDGRVLTSGPQGAVLWEGAQSEGLGALAGEVAAAALLPDGSILVGGSSGLYAAAPGGLVASPLGEALGQPSVSALQVAGDDLWIATADALYRWRAGEVAPIEPQDLPVAGATLFWGPAVDGVAALWVHAGETLYALVEGAEGLYSARVDGAFSGAAGDAKGRLWACGGGLLRVRDAQGEWAELPLEASVDAVLGHREADAVWLLSGDQIVHVGGDIFRSAPLEPSPAGAVTTAEGALLVFGDGGASLLRPRGNLSLTGLPSEGIRAPVTLTLHVDDPATVDAVSADIDGAPVAFDAQLALDLDPASLAEGPHTLRIEVSYTDWEQTSSLTQPFTVLPPRTWADDVGPLYAAKCDGCHNPKWSSHPLDTAERWRAEIEDIYDNVVSGLMPKAPSLPLETAEIALIKEWWDAGMPD